jgi:sugar phosphate permease
MLERDNVEHINNNNNYSSNDSRTKKIHMPKESMKDVASFGGVDKSKFTLLDKIINDYGYGWEVNKIIFSAFLCFILNGYLTTSYCSFMLGFKKKFDLTTNQISFIGMGFCLSKFVTNFLIGFLTNLLGRMFVLKFSLIFTFFSNLLISLFCEYKIIVIVEFINGFFAGIFEITSFNVACEFIPVRFRGWILLTIWNGYNVGVLFPNLIMSKTMPEHDPSGLPRTLYLCSLVILLCTIFGCVFYTDSPRNYIINGKNEDAIKILKKMKKDDSYFTDEIKKEIFESVPPKTISDFSLANYKEVFEHGMFSTGLLLLIICFNGTMINDGFQLVLNLILEKVKHSDKSAHTRTILMENIIINSVALPSNLIIGAFTEFKILGRKNTQSIGFFIMGSVIIPVIINPNLASTFFIFFMFFTCITNMVNVYVSEVYPTKIRDWALGMIQGSGYLGSFIAQYLFVYLNDLNVYYCPILFFVTCTLNGILCSLLKVEPMGKPLDIHTRNDSVLNKEKSPNSIEMPLYT